MDGEFACRPRFWLLALGAPVAPEKNGEGGGLKDVALGALPLKFRPKIAFVHIFGKTEPAPEGGCINHIRETEFSERLFFIEAMSPNNRQVKRAFFRFWEVPLTIRFLHCRYRITESESNLAVDSLAVRQANRMVFISWFLMALSIAYMIMFYALGMDKESKKHRV